MARKTLIGLLALLGVFSLPVLSYAQTDFTVTPSSVYQGDSVDIEFSSDNPDMYWVYFDINGTSQDFGQENHPVYFLGTGYGANHFLLVDISLGNNCRSITYEECLGESSYQNVDITINVIPIPDPTPSSPSGYFTVASTTSVFDGFNGSAVSILLGVLLGVFLTGVSLLGIGFAWYHYKKLVTGRKI